MPALAHSVSLKSIAAVLGGGRAFSPLSLFAASEPGGWYDPSDLTTLFQDAAGTTPVTAVEQPVGRVLDKSGRGNHLSQSTSTARPVLSARVNDFLYTEDFSNAYWTKGELNTTGTPAWINVGTAPNGTTTADAIIPNTTNTYHGFSRTGITVQNTTIRFSVRVKANGYNFIALQFANAGTFAKYFEGIFNLTNGTVENTGRAVTYTGTRNTPVALGDGWYECSITVNSVDANATSVAQVIVMSTNDPTASFAGDGTKSVLVWGADLRPFNAGVGLPAYQRVTTSTDYDTTGFPLYLKFDGTDDSLSSAAINFTSTDKMSVFAGMRKLNDAADGTLAELSANQSANNGSFFLGAPVSASPNANYWITLRGTTSTAFAARTYAAPISNVIAYSMDISGATRATELFPRINGVIPSSLTGADSADAGTGNFGNYPLYVGSRAGTSVRFNGHLYSLIVRGAATDAATITATETWVNGKTKAY